MVGEQRQGGFVRRHRHSRSRPPDGPHGAALGKRKGIGKMANSPQL
ncbi:hypothetical protein BURMUCGD1_0658 [Burkholderia multivorans CGD1]|nr:hypothetical protein BURMUCGD1_0658 [Burkholderia multivorans CGD1]